MTPGQIVGLVWFSIFNGISTSVGYLMPEPFFYKNNSGTFFFFFFFFYLWWGWCKGVHDLFMGIFFESERNCATGIRTHYDAAVQHVNRYATVIPSLIIY